MLFSPKRIQLFFLTLLIIVAIFFRTYKIRDYIVFLGDEGRDAIVMRDIFVNHHLPFLGPTASVGGFYLGPIYYWMAAPFLFLWHYDPVGPAYFVAIIGILTVLLLFRFIKEETSFWPAFLASLLYATAPLIVRYSRSSWNPNPLPFFSLLLIYFIYKGIKEEKSQFFLLAGACFGIAIQLHYLSLVLVPIAALITILNQNYKKIPLNIFFALLGAAITFSPFLFFEIRHNFPNFKTIFEFATRGSTLSFRSPNIIWLVSNGGNIFLESISSYVGTIFTRTALWALALSSTACLVINWQNKAKKLIFSITTIYFICGVLFLRFYSGQIYDYYYGSIFPSPFLLFGIIIGLFWNKDHVKVIAIFLTVIIFGPFLQRGFYKEPPNRLIEQTEKIADLIIEKTDNNPYNFALITNSNSDQAYRYFLDIKNHKPTVLEDNITDQLIILCESQACSPLGNSLWEIAAFGRGEVTGQWDLPQYGFKIYRLIHWPGEPSPAGKPAKKLG